MKNTRDLLNPDGGKCPSWDHVIACGMEMNERTKIRLWLQCKPIQKMKGRMQVIIYICILSSA